MLSPARKARKMAGTWAATSARKGSSWLLPQAVTSAQIASTAAVTISPETPLPPRLSAAHRVGALSGAIATRLPGLCPATTVEADWAETTMRSARGYESG
jgi:hypothetical protein